ncbi:Phosphatidylethanolamine [Venturia nashicola]|uniref:Phosphatidylethanolamine n=1 Tax=Venturia nashicola TaxID=86259 RepID=A0A4Z1NJ92_9PEZI|nr:Phosphatidylethanolamine [Venturia nashicola]TLD19357.1 Phosphatidylethanolamine [Venturia nashicola]
MLFTRLAVLSFAAGTFAAPIAPIAPNVEAAASQSIYEVATNRVTYEVEQLNVKLDAIILARPEQRNAAAAAIKEQVGHVLHAEADGANSMRGAKPATVLEASTLGLLPVNQLTTATMASAGKWTRIKDIVYQMGGQQKVVEMLTQMKTAGMQFSAEMNHQMPYGTQTVGKAYGDAVDRTMTTLIREYSQPPRHPSAGWL